MARAGVVHVEVCGEPVTGLWCDRCMLPSVFAQFIRIAGRLQLMQQCYDCRHGRHLA